MYGRNLKAAAGAMLVLALAIAIFGCGSGGSSGSLSKAQFLKKGVAICVEGTEEIGRLDEAAWAKYDPNHTSQSEVIRWKVALALLPPREKELRRLRALGLPEGDETYVERMLDAWEEGIETGKRHPWRLLAGGSDFAFAETYRMADDYGLEKCWLA